MARPVRMLTVIVGLTRHSGPSMIPAGPDKYVVDPGVVCTVVTDATNLSQSKTNAELSLSLLPLRAAANLLSLIIIVGLIVGHIGMRGEARR